MFRLPRILRKLYTLYIRYIKRDEISASVQPSIISLFSSTGPDPFNLFRISVDRSLPSDSFLHFLHDRYSNPPPPPPGALLHLPNISEQDNSSSHGYELDQTVLLIQSPTIQTTYIQCPKAESRDRSNAWGVKHMDVSPGSQFRKGMGFRS